MKGHTETEGKTVNKDFTLNTARLTARPSGALWWQEHRLLCVSDLHLGKSERAARRGGALLPPYDSRETLSRLSAEVALTQPDTVICLGDSFDDLTAAAALTSEITEGLNTLMAGRKWIWIEGNHDPGPIEMGGKHLAEWAQGPLTFRHIAAPKAQGEVSGHYHPKAAVAGRYRPAFLRDEARVILPAFGAYTGGLRAGDTALSGLMQARATALLTGKRIVECPLTP
ncbi:ligase-associated DNA damage response endonuclease PdeM [Alphaproteobacteria bacterium KMM 3653]|uniref:Ligase-associated DNA damage response endonuclease PdeM n=1 Tax=Harenicola maris TaxID=2841044 RepID=A0AAP2G2T0_9RHOB|nr:ligase-associated DNA damage response endonuclease PdeM [Harenicola maris]